QVALIPNGPVEVITVFSVSLEQVRCDTPDKRVPLEPVLGRAGASSTACVPGEAIGGQIARRLLEVDHEPPPVLAVNEVPFVVESNPVIDGRASRPILP